MHPEDPAVGHLNTGVLMSIILQSYVQKHLLTSKVFNFQERNTQGRTQQEGAQHTCASEGPTHTVAVTTNSSGFLIRYILTPDLMMAILAETCCGF
jgi:hypothetical protein